MELKPALAEQYHAGLAMLADCVTKCPDGLWISGAPAREYWRIALHAAFFTQLYLGQGSQEYIPWPDRPEKHENMWTDPAYVEPYELPQDAEHLTQIEVLAYIAWLDSEVDYTVANLDLQSDDSGFSWYPNFSKLSHQLMNLRHLQAHAGQLSELLLAQGIETEWIGKGTKPNWHEWEDANP